MPGDQAVIPIQDGENSTVVSRPLPPVPAQSAPVEEYNDTAINTGSGMGPSSNNLDATVNSLTYSHMVSQALPTLTSNLAASATTSYRANGAESRINPTNAKAIPANDNTKTNQAPIHPTEKDVIFGRGEPTRTHSGNLILREFVNDRLQEYMQTTKTRKSAIIGEVISDIELTGARYLVPLDASSRQSIFASGCRAATRTEIRSKVSHAFRDGEKRALLRRKKALNASPGAKGSKKAVNLEPSADADQGNASVNLNEPLAGQLQEIAPRPKKNIKNEDRAIGNSTKGTPPRAVLSTAQKGDAASDLLSFATILTSLRETSPSSAQNGNSASAPEEQLPGSMTPISMDNSFSMESENPNKESRSRTRGGPIMRRLEMNCDEFDIVFGRGAPLRRHPGNIRFRKIVEAYTSKYRMASKLGKSDIIQEVIQKATVKGSQFLIMEEGTVKEASCDEIRMKVSHRFRDFTKAINSSKVKDSSTDNDDRPGIGGKAKKTGTVSSSNHVVEQKHSGSIVQV